MATTRSAGILLHRGDEPRVEVLLGHPGGPYWARRDLGAWSVPKGECHPDEDPLTAARREFAEEVGQVPPPGPYRDLGEVRMRGGKVVCAWAVPGDLDPADAVSNTFTLEWPPRSGRMTAFPELDRVEWFDLATARLKIIDVQSTFLTRLATTGGGFGS